MYPLEITRKPDPLSDGFVRVRCFRCRVGWEVVINNANLYSSFDLACAVMFDTVYHGLHMVSEKCIHAVEYLESCGFTRNVGY